MVKKMTSQELRKILGSGDDTDFKYNKLAHFIKFGVYPVL